MNNAVRMAIHFARNETDFCNEILFVNEMNRDRKEVRESGEVVSFSMDLADDY